MIDQGILIDDICQMCKENIKDDDIIDLHQLN